MHILIIDDNTTSLESLRVVLSDLGHTPSIFTNPLEALEETKKKYYPLIITDIRMPEMNGLDFLQAIKNSPPNNTSDVVLITGHGDMETAVTALRSGAYDYLNKPINARELSAVVERSAEHQSLLLENADLKNNLDNHVSQATSAIKQDLAKARKKLQELEGIGSIVAASPAMVTLMDMTQIFHSDPSVPVMVEGETGTGKEIFARLIHFGDTGAETPFIPINCSAIPSELFENELFGHEGGAYTGSRSSGALGKLELAGEGTLFLDEVAELPLMLQPKLLRVLEERQFYRVGGTRKKEFKARVVCAANRQLEEMVEEGLFRRDLYHRLKVGHINIPPLRKRPEDITALASLFLKRQTARKRKHFTSFSPNALRLLQGQNWFGNVRELENAIERAVLIHDDTQLRCCHLDFLDSPPLQQAPQPHTEGHMESSHKRKIHTIQPSIPLDIENLELPENPLNLDALTTAIIYKALARFNGNKSQAAAYLGISRYALHRRLQKD